MKVVSVLTLAATIFGYQNSGFADDQRAIQVEILNIGAKIDRELAKQVYLRLAQGVTNDSLEEYRSSIKGWEGERTLCAVFRLEEQAKAGYKDLLALTQGKDKHLRVRQGCPSLKRPQFKLEESQVKKFDIVDECSQKGLDQMETLLKTQLNVRANAACSKIGRQAFEVSVWEVAEKACISSIEGRVRLGRTYTCM